GGAEKARPALYDLASSVKMAAARATPAVQIAVPEPTTVLQFDTQRILAPADVAPDGAFENAQWSDSLPKLFQARIIQSFENAGFGRIVRDEVEVLVSYRLLIDIRSVHLTHAPDLRGEVQFGAKLLNAEGQIVGYQLFQAQTISRGTSAADAAA